jgi:hypothetical protein
LNYGPSGAIAPGDQIWQEMNTKFLILSPGALRLCEPDLPTTVNNKECTISITFFYPTLFQLNFSHFFTTNTLFNHVAGVAAFHHIVLYPTDTKEIPVR